MPIRPQHRWLYPIDWPQLSAVIRFERAKGRCEQCARPHGQLVCHLGDGRWWDEERGRWRDDRGRLVRAALPAPARHMRTTRVYLATAHLDHDPGNSHPRNLAALCQRCHLLHDRPEHQRRRWITLRMRKAIGDLFLGPYPPVHFPMEAKRNAPYSDAPRLCRMAPLRELLDDLGAEGR